MATLEMTEYADQAYWSFSIQNDKNERPLEMFNSIKPLRPVRIFQNLASSNFGSRIVLP